MDISYGNRKDSRTESNSICTMSKKVKLPPEARRRAARGALHATRAASQASRPRVPPSVMSKRQRGGGGGLVRGITVLSLGGQILKHDLGLSGVTRLSEDSFV